MLLSKFGINNKEMRLIFSKQWFSDHDLNKFFISKIFYLLFYRLV